METQRVLAPVGFGNPRLRFEHIVSPPHDTWDLDPGAAHANLEGLGELGGRSQRGERPSVGMGMPTPLSKLPHDASKNKK